MTEAQSIGTARIDVVVNTATMESGAEAAKRKVAGLGTEAAAQFDKANASTKRYAESLLRQAELLGKSRAEQLAYNAEVRVGGELGAKIAEVVRARAAAMEQERTATGQAAEAERNANALRAAAAEEVARRTQNEMTLRDKQWAQTRAIFASEQRLASMRADALHAFGPELAARERENAEIQRSNGVRDRLTAFLATEKGQRIAAAEAIRNQGKAYNEASKATDQYVMSDKARAAAMRGVPAQITDIVSGLATGQRPLTVLLQQGGQLKDMFGGVGGAAKALGTSLLGLINPATLLAGAAVALFAAWKSGSDEQVAFQKALINTGNYAGVTSQQLQALSADLSKSSGTQHDAAAALADVAASGKFTSDQLRLVASATIAAGDGADDMVARFAKLADDPVKASVELNATYHYLTAAVYDQIKALEDQGRTQDAARLAMETYSTAVVSRSKEVKENLGLIERSWNGISDATKRAIDAARDFGRAQTDQQKFDVLAENRDAAKKLIDRGMGSTSFYGKTAQQFYDDATKQLGAMQDAQVAAQKKASRDAATQQANEAAISLDQQARQYESDEAKRSREIAAIHQQANDAIAKATLAGDKALADKIRASETAAVAGIMAQGKKPKAERDEVIDVSAGWKDMVAQIEKGIAADKKEIEQRARATVELNSYREAMQQRLETDRMALDVQVQSLGMGQHQIDIQRQLLDIQRDADRELARLNDPANRRTLTDDEYQARLSAIKDYEDQRVQLVYDADARLNAARSDWTNGARRAMADITYDVSDAATNFANLVQSTYGSLSDFIVDAATTGKASIKDLVSSILKEVARLEANKAAASLLSYGLSYFTGGYGGTNGAGGVDYNSQGFVSKVYAKGGVVDGASLSSWSNTVVDRPTTFAFARGAGLMGEAGPEAIMPLTRTADGKLGVRTQGDGGDTNISIAVTVNSDGSSAVDAAGSDQAMGKKFGTAIESAVKKVIANEQRPGGSLWRARANA